MTFIKDLQERENRTKLHIIEANNFYRIGKPIMSDQEFDDLCEKYKETISEQEWNEFRNSLHENSGKVKHPYVMGSLNKLKFEEPETVWKFVNDHVEDYLSISKKVDGISCRLFYDNGKLVSASTRGDGMYGEDLTDKIKYVKGIPWEISYKYPFSVRGELIILKEDFEKMNSANEWKNPRNACAGLMNRKEFSPEDISNVSFVCYTILGRRFFKRDQFKQLAYNGFKVVKYFEISREKLDKLLEDKSGKSLCDELYKMYEYETPYECDGLVISDTIYVNENAYRPDGEVAFKVNEMIGEATLIDVSWEGPSKMGKMVPVAILDGVELGGAMITRVTLNNVDFLEKFNLKYGAKVRIMKSGNIIPKLIGVVENGVSDIVYPETCPSCGEKLSRCGVDLKCTNNDCRTLRSSKTLSIFNKFGIDGVSVGFIEKWNLQTIDDILKFRAIPKVKSQEKFIIELERKMFCKSDIELFLRMDFNGISEKILKKIIDHYGWNNLKETFIKCDNGLWKADDSLKEFPTKYGWPTGIGQLMWDRFIEGIDSAVETMHKIMDDGRYVGKIDFYENSSGRKFKGSICVTGSLKFGSRSKFYEFAEQNGYEAKPSVTKGLTYLITNVDFPSSSKATKAREFGIKVISEDYFMKMIKEDAIENGQTDLDNL